MIKHTTNGLNEAGSPPPTFDQPAGFGGREGFIKRSLAVDVEIVLDQYDGLGVGKVDIDRGSAPGLRKQTKNVPKVLYEMVGKFVDQSHRRLARGFERSATTVASFIRLAMIRIMLGDLLQMPRHESKRALHAGSLGNS